jgi:multidrug efflux pump subunit AcrB
MIAWMTRHPVASNLLMFLILVGGWTLGSNVKQEIFPEFALDFVNVTVSYPGASPAEVEESLVVPLENALRGVAGIKTIEATAAEGGANLTVEVEAGEDVQRVKDDMQGAVDRITTLPDDAESPRVSAVQLRNEVLNVMVYGDAPERSLREWALEVRNELLNHPGITQVELERLRNFEITIELKQQALSQYGLTLPVIAQKIQQSTLDLPGGRLQTDGGDILIRTKEQRYSGQEYARVPILNTDSGSVLLGDIATIRDGFEESDVRVRYNGFPAERLQVYRVSDQTPTAISEAARGVIVQLENRLPLGVSAAVLFDRSIILQERIDLLLRNLWMGLVLVLLVLALFLNLELSFWIMLGIPISFAGALFVMPSLDASINMISLFAFILVLGIVVDDAIVVGENIYAHHERGESWMRAAVKGTEEIGRPVLTTILTTIAAFLPFFFIPGVFGKFFQVIPYVVIATLIFSLIEVIFILPAHLGHKTPRWIQFFVQPLDDRLRQVRAFCSTHLQRIIEGPYRRYLHLALEFRYATLMLGIVALMLCGGLVGSGHMKFTFFPRIDSDVIFVNASFPFGTTLSVTERLEARLLDEADQLLQGYEQRQGVPVHDGVYSILGGGGTHRLQVILFLKPLGERGFAAQEFARKWETAVGEVAGLERINFNASTGVGAESDIEVQFTHPNGQVLESVVAQVKDALLSYNGVTNVDDSRADGKEEIRLRLSPEGLALGLNARELTRQVSAAFQGLEVTTLLRDSEEVTVKLRLPPEERRSLRDLTGLLVATPQGGQVPLARVALLEQGLAESSITRIDTRRVLNVQADIDASVGGNAGQVIKALQTEVLPSLQQQYPQLQTSFEGAKSDQDETFAGIQQGGVVALFIIYSLLALQFRSYTQPMIIMTAIPFGIVGSVIGHLLLGFDLSVVSVLGIVALSGVVVNDSLILVDFINQKRAQGLSLLPSVVESGMRRFRPILLTSLTTFLGLMPIVFEQSLQARFIIPMAIGLAFGVMFATVIILFLIPVLYLILHDLQSLFHRNRDADEISMTVIRSHS